VGLLLMKSVALILISFLVVNSTATVRAQGLETASFRQSLVDTGFLADIYSGGSYARNYSEYIHIILNDDKTATFQFCEADGAHCRLLGSRDRYPLRDLQYRYRKLKHEARRTIESDVSYVVLSAIVGTIAVLAAPTPVGPETIAIFAASGAAGTAVSLVRTYATPGAASAIQKYQEAKLINDDVLADRPVYVNEPITETAKRLDAVLRDIF
jgi:hypothetical protein